MAAKKKLVLKRVARKDTHFTTPEKIEDQEQQEHRKELSIPYSIYKRTMLPRTMTKRMQAAKEQRKNHVK